MEGLIMYKEKHIGDFQVDDNGISVIVDISDGFCTAQMIMPKETFIEAYNKYIGDQENDSANS